VLARLIQLGRNLAIYGLGDVATSLLSFLLLPLYVRYLSPEDYGVIGLLLSVEVLAKIAFRWGVDASFMRLYYDCPDDASRQTLASTLFFFLVACNGALLAVALAVTPWIASHLFGRPVHVAALRLVLLNTFVVGFYFLPFHVLRIEGRSPQFIALTIARSFATLVLRLVFVVAFRWGVLGVVLADVVVTAVFTAVLARAFAQLVRPVFSGAVLRDALGFGLPRLPHGLAHQLISVADRYILTQFVTLREIGLYSIGVSFGLTMKLFLSAFEYAWAPFYFATMREADAQRTFKIVTTYGLAVLALLGAGLSAVAADAVRLMTQPEFFAAAEVVPWIALGVVFQGAYLLTSIGLNITKQTRYYPVATLCAAVTSVAANLALVPRFGALGSAWANVLAYAVLAAVGMALSQRFYPIRYDWSRIVAVAVAGVGAFLAAAVAVPSPLPALVAVLLRGLTVLVTYPVLLLATGFYDAQEIAAVRRALRRARPGRRAPVAGEASELAGEMASAPMPDETADAAAVAAIADPIAEGPDLKARGLARAVDRGAGT
jgi:O-antigen/teichoic acid export membrane protein